MSFTTPVFSFDPMSAVAENWPLVNPYTPLFSITYTSGMFLRSMCMYCPSPMETVSPSPVTHYADQVAVGEHGSGCDGRSPAVNCR